MSQYQITNRYGRVTVIQKMTKYQKELFKTLGLSEVEIKEEIKTIEGVKNEVK